MKSKTIKILALLLTACVFLGVTSCSGGSGGEEETTEATTIASATPLMTEKAEVLAYFNSVMAAAKAGKAAVKYSSNYDPNGFECENATFKAALPTITKLMKDGFNADLGAEAAYGDSLADIVPVKGGAALALTEADIVDIAINPEAFSKLAEEESKLANDSEYSTESAIIVDEDVRKITITLADEADPQAGAGLFGRIYNIPDRAMIAEEMAKASDYMTYDGTYSAKYTGCSIYMEIDRTTDKVIKVEFHRNIEVDVTVTGVGTLEALGTTPLHFVVNGADVYEFDWNEPTTVAEAE
ncbi:MAG: hypothetical protein IKK85_04065 [Clostridia bacterium]|nr:hypothetical protein [Clostridia bacterium]